MLKSLCITVGLNLLLMGLFILFSHMVREELGQALLFLVTSLLLCVGVCLFATIRTDSRGILWASMGISEGTHLILTVVVALVGGTKLSEAWPGYANLVWLLLALLSLAVWDISVLVITVVRSHRLGRAAREEKRQVNRAKKGYRKEWQPLSPSRARFLAFLRGILVVLWCHLLTGLIFALLVNWDLAETMMGYVAFPLLWCLLAAAYGLHDREHRAVYILSAAMTNLLLFLLSTALLTVSKTPSIQYRFILHLDSVLTEPFENPEQMLSIGIFLSLGTAMIIFGIGHKPLRAPVAGPRHNVIITPIAPPPAVSVPPVSEAAPVDVTEPSSEAAPEAVPAEPIESETVLENSLGSSSDAAPAERMGSAPEAHTDQAPDGATGTIPDIPSEEPVGITPVNATEEAAETDPQTVSNPSGKTDDESGPAIPAEPIPETAPLAPEIPQDNPQA